MKYRVEFAVMGGGVEGTGNAGLPACRKVVARLPLRVLPACAAASPVSRAQTPPPP